jgi:Leucine-rich repeat (LRR) protein
MDKLGRWNCLFIGKRSLRKIEELVVTQYEGEDYLLKEGDFKGLTSLKKLRVFRSGLEEITKETFKDLKDLRTLHIESRALKSVDPEAFLKNEKLIILNLFGVGLGEIPRIESPSLLTFFFSGAKVKELVSENFAGMPMLQRLHISKTAIERIEEQALVGLPELLRLTLRDNTKTISLLPQVFHESPKLLWLSLKNAGIERLSTGVFNPLVEVKHIDISGNPLGELEGETFWYNSKVEILFIEEVGISEIPEDLLYRKWWLKELSLSDNPVEEIGLRRFNSVGNLRKLYLQGMALRSVKREEFEGLNNLQTLRIANNPLDRLSVDSFAELRKLEVLWIYNGRFEALPLEIFSQNMRLKSVGMGEDDPILPEFRLKIAAQYPAIKFHYYEGL